MKHELIIKDLANKIYDTCNHETQAFLKKYVVMKLLDEFQKDLLTDFLDFLLKESYCDTDVYCEPPTAIDQYLILKS